MTRTATAKDDENANARPSRIATRAKPLSSGSAVKGTKSLTRATAATAASRAKATGDCKVDSSAGKRKREALGEVTKLVTNNRSKDTLGSKTVKGKENPKERFDGITLKDKPSTDVKKRTAGPVTRRTTRRTAVAPPPQPESEDVKEETKAKAVPEVLAVIDENAMVIDPVSSALVPPVFVPPISKRESKDVIEPAATHPPETRHTFPRVLDPVAEEDEEELSRVFKKRRTSSEPPADAPEEPQQEERALSVEIAAQPHIFVDPEPEADPNGDEWQDLDEEDEDDPLMVSEYVGEIFQYLKELEVRSSFLVILLYQCFTFTAHNDAESRLYGKST